MLNEIINDFDVNRFTRFFREKNRAFAPRQEELFHYDDENFKKVYKLGEIKFTDVEELIICTINVMKSLTKRSGKKAQFEKAKKILKEIHSDSGIFIFYDQNGNFRFSLIYANYLGTKRDWSNFRRFTYFVCKEFTNKTFLQRIGKGDFSSLEKIKDAFSVAKVTKQFYKDISYWYFWAIRNTEFPQDAEKEDNGRNIAIIRLITRLIFIWFMRERKLIPGNLFDYQKIKQIIEDISPGKTTYYKAILQNLFFATLNTKERKYRFQITGWKNSSYMDHSVYRYQDYFINSAKALEIFKEIPFLNGGLFDCFDRRITVNKKNVEIRIDGFSDKEVGLKFPNFLFFSEETNADLNKDFGTKNKNYKVQGLINILSAYNFTIDENDPNDQEVALDPELLGKVFENLLASFNPETSSTARKATGSYYTPREIVDYMVTQSIKEYLKTHLKDVEELDKKLDDLFATGNENNPFDDEDTKIIVKLIDALRIVDPAVGSGAFPMGILNKLVFILSKLDPENYLWKQTQINAVAQNVPDPVIKQDLINQIEIKFREKNPDYGRKLYLIQKCIYGVDIQQIAVEIAKLRFFISLLVDEKIDKEKDNWGIEALPNLDFKIMQGNSLISEFMGINFDEDENKNNDILSFEDDVDQLIKIFQEKKNEFQNESDKHKKDKLTNEIEDLIIRIFENKLQKQKADYFSRLKGIENKYSVIPNEEQRNKMISKEKEELYKRTGFNLDEVEKQLREFSSGNKTKPFFLWKLYFAEVFQGDNPGFDIVIANPPWGIKFNEEQQLKQFFRVNKSLDSSEYFILRSKQLMYPLSVLTFIVPKSMIFANNWKTSRKYLLERIIIDVADAGITFENVNLESFVFVVKNTKNTDVVNKVKINKFEPVKKYAPIKILHRLPCINQDVMCKANSIILADLCPVSKNIIYKIQKSGQFLDSIPRDVFRGLYIPDSVKEKILDKGKGLYVNKVPDVGLYIIKRVRNINLSNIKITKEKILNKLDRNRIIVKVLRGKKLTCTFVERGILTTEKLVNLVLKDANYSYFFILGILNSSLTSFYFAKAVFSDITETSRVMDDCYLSKTPIKKLNSKEQKPFISIVGKILAMTDDEDYMQNPIKQSKVKELEKQIDVMVYKLYELTYEEVKIVDSTFALSKEEYEQDLS